LRNNRYILFAYAEKTCKIFIMSPRLWVCVPGTTVKFFLLLMLCHHCYVWLWLQHSADCFGYWCGKLFAIKALAGMLYTCKRSLWFVLWNASRWPRQTLGTHVIHEYCRRTLEDWLRGEKRAMRFPIPTSGVSPETISQTVASVWWIQANGEKEKMQLPSGTLTFHHLLIYGTCTPQHDWYACATTTLERCMFHNRCKFYRF